MAHLLMMHKLKQDLSQLIVKEYLLPGNAAHYLYEAIRFNSHFLKAESQKKLIEEFQVAIQTEEGRKMLKNLPFYEFLAIVNSQDLGVHEEMQVVSLVDEYVEHKMALQKDLDEVDPEEAKHLTPDELARREEARKLRAETKLQQKAEELKAQEAKLAAMTPVARIQERINWNSLKERIAMDERLAEKRLTRDQRRQLFLALKYNYMKHDDLIRTSMNPNFEEAKDFIMEGLSFRLNPFETTQHKDYKINLKPRKFYGKEMERALNADFASKKSQSSLNGYNARGQMSGRQNAGVNANLSGRQNATANFPNPRATSRGS